MRQESNTYHSAGLDRPGRPSPTDPARFGRPGPAGPAWPAQPARGGFTNLKPMWGIPPNLKRDSLTQTAGPARPARPARHGRPGRPGLVRPEE